MLERSINRLNGVKRCIMVFRDSRMNRVIRVVRVIRVSGVRD